jgi:hypothetical protein
MNKIFFSNFIIKNLMINYKLSISFNVINQLKIQYKKFAGWDIGSYGIKYSS